MSLKKTEYTKYLKIAQPGGHGYMLTFEVNKTFLCDMANANACAKRAPWYGVHTIGPRIYAVYKCPDHGIFNRRL